MLLRVFLVLLGVVGVCDAMRVKDNIRIPLTSTNNNCMRMVNGTHQVGCQSARDGNTGVVVLVQTGADLERHARNLPWGLSSIVALVNVKNLDKKLLVELKDSAAVVGVLLYRRAAEKFGGFSEDAACPNRLFSFYPPAVQCEWNAEGALTADGSAFLDYEKPMFVLTNETEIQMLLQSCYNAFNYPTVESNNRCVVRMQSFMFAAGDARLCRERSTHSSLTQQGTTLCDDLWDYNIVSVLPALDYNTPRGDAILLATRMDSFSLFSGSREGEVSVLVSLIAALSVAKSVGQNRAVFEAAARERRKQAIFAFFHIESLGYVGSSSLVYEMEQPTPPLRYKPDRQAKHLHLEDVGALVELQQLSAKHGRFFLHGDGGIASGFRKEMGEFKDAAQRGARRSAARPQVSVLYEQPTARVPPASYQTFLKGRHIPGFVLTPFEAAYETRVLNSFFDHQVAEAEERERTRAEIVAEVEAAAGIALQVVLEYVNGTDLAARRGFEFDRKFATDLVDCFVFTHKWDCPFFTELMTNQSRRGDLLGYARIRKLVDALTVYALGDTDSTININAESVCLAKNKDQDLYVYHWQLEPASGNFRCYRTSTYAKLARSPAFQIEDYDLANGTYSSWMESRWETVELEMFLDAGHKFELHAFGAALVSIALGLLLFFFLDETWFVDATDVLPADV
ncbi:Nicastrin [Aphelenchoides fujianensis]|nr:Nicastrin [Aphelenchoides fujianensis]